MNLTLGNFPLITFTCQGQGNFSKSEWFLVVFVGGFFKIKNNKKQNYLVQW